MDITLTTPLSHEAPTDTRTCEPTPLVFDRRLISRQQIPKYTWKWDGKHRP